MRLPLVPGAGLGDYSSKLHFSRRSNTVPTRVRKSHGSKISSSFSLLTVQRGSASSFSRSVVPGSHRCTSRHVAMAFSCTIL